MIKYVLFSISILSPMLLTGCLNRTSAPKEKEIVSQEQLSKDSLEVLCLPGEKEKLSYLEQTDTPPFDLNNLKEKYDRFDGFTSGMVPASECKQFYRPAEEGFYGGYNLLEPNAEPGFDGRIIVFNNEYPWYYVNDTDIFIELTAYNPDIVIFENIHVAMAETALKDKLGEPYYDKDGILLYVAKNKNLIAMFKILNSKVKWIRVGYYKDDVLEAPEAYFNILTDVPDLD